MSRNSWLESVYDMSDYYFWEPGHIFKMAIPGCKGKEYVDKANRSARRNEVPLNSCFNILMRILPDKMIADIFKQAHSVKPIDLNDSCTFVKFKDEIGDVSDFIQPDAVLESPRTRLFVELKLGAKIDLKQITKYLYFHEEWNRRLGQTKDMVLLILTSHSLKSSFKTAERDQVFPANSAEEIRSVQEYLADYDTSQHNRRSGVNMSHLDESVFALRRQVTLAHMTWAELADNLETQSKGDLEKIIQDFVLDIRAR